MQLSDRDIVIVPHIMFVIGKGKFKFFYLRGIWKLNSKVGVH